MKERSKNLLTDEVQSALSNTNKNILNASLYIHFKDIAKSEQEKKIREVLAYCSVVYGIKNPPDDTSINIILDYFRRYYPNITIEEVKIAFDINLQRGDENKPQHFQTITLDFIIANIKYFLIKKTDAINALKMATPKELPKPESTDEDYYNRLIKVAEEKKEVPHYWNWTKVYNYMNASGLVTESLEWKNELKSVVMEQIKIDNEMSKMDTPDAIGRARIDATFTPETIKGECHKEYVRFKVCQKLNIEYIGILSRIKTNA